jgi:uncharacterized membrane protein HdeD (DUF308 family)
MQIFFSKLWWTVSIRGLLLLIFGIIAVSTPLITPDTLMSYLGFMELGLGIVTGLVVLSLRKNISNWYVILPIALLDLILGVIIILNTHAAAKYFSLAIAAWALTMGIVQFIVAIKPGPLRIFLIINGVLSLGFAIIIYTNPFAGNNPLNFMVGFYTILLSLFLLFIGFKMRTIGVAPKLVEQKGKDQYPKP